MHWCLRTYVWGFGITGEPLEQHNQKLMLDCIDGSLTATKVKAREKGKTHKWVEICLQLPPMEKLFFMLIKARKTVARPVVLSGQWFSGCVLLLIN